MEIVTKDHYVDDAYRRVIKTLTLRELFNERAAYLRQKEEARTTSAYDRTRFRLEVVEAEVDRREAILTGETKEQG